MQIVNQVLQKLCSAEDSISGEQLAQELYVSRNAVWKAITELRRRGFAIEAATNRGYRLSHNNTKLCAEQIQLFVHSKVNLLLYDCTDSTNITAKQLAEQGAPEGTVVVSLTQSKGRGRLGRNFYSPSGGIYFSILLRPQCNPQIALQATVAAAVAVAQAIDTVCGTNCGIKWVNDIFLEGKKVCGILTEGSFNAETGQLDYAVLGIGINLTEPESGYPQEIAGIAGALFRKTTPGSETTSRLIASVIDNFFAFYNDIDAKSYLEEYRNRSVLIGKEVSFLRDGTPCHATVCGIDDQARLIVSENNQTTVIGAGEVSVRLEE